MLIRASELQNVMLAAKDGDIGRCKGFLFDDEHWTVRYMEASTGKWLPGRRVLISPAAIKTPLSKPDRLPVTLTREQIENAPGIDHDRPVSRQYEKAYSRYYGYGFYWLGSGLWGLGGAPHDLLPGPTGADVDQGGASEGSANDEDEHLRATEEVTGYVVHASDGNIGAVDDFVIDTDTWEIVFLAIDTRRWLPGKKVLLPVAWASEISWVERELTVDVRKLDIETAPELEEPFTTETVTAYYRHFGDRASKRRLSA